MKASLPNLNLTSYLKKNIPNPFKEKAEIELIVSDGVNKAAINIYNQTGKQLKSIDVHHYGSQKVYINASELPLGKYYYSLIPNYIIDTK